GPSLSPAPFSIFSPGFSPALSLLSGAGAAGVLLAAMSSPRAVLELHFRESLESRPALESRDELTAREGLPLECTRRRRTLEHESTLPVARDSNLLPRRLAELGDQRLLDLPHVQRPGSRELEAPEDARDLFHSGGRRLAMRPQIHKLIGITT